MADYADILNDLGMNDDKSDDSTQKEPANDNDMKDDNPKRNVLHRRLSAQKSLVEELRQKVDTLTKKLKLSEQNNRLLQDQLEELHTIANVEQNEILTENLQLKTKCNEWKVKYEEEQKDNQQLKDEIKQLEEENEQFKMKSLDHSAWKEWTENDVYLFLMSIGDGVLKSYQSDIKTFVNDSQVKGADLPSFTMNDWKDCGITVFGHRKDIVEVIKVLTDENILFDEGNTPALNV
eukprot:904095_1